MYMSPKKTDLDHTDLCSILVSDLSSETVRSDCSQQSFSYSKLHFAEQGINVCKSLYSKQIIDEASFKMKKKPKKLINSSLDKTEASSVLIQCGSLVGTADDLYNVKITFLAPQKDGLKCKVKKKARISPEANRLNARGCFHLWAVGE